MKNLDKNNISDSAENEAVDNSLVINHVGKILSRDIITDNQIEELTNDPNFDRIGINLLRKIDTKLPKY